MSESSGRPLWAVNEKNKGGQRRDNQSASGSVAAWGAAMGILDTLQAAWGKLTGEDERRRLQQEKEQEARKEAQREADRKLVAEQEAARKAAEAERQRLAERISPANRLMGRDLTNPPAVQNTMPAPEPDRQEVPTHLDLSLNPQPAPSQPRPGTVFGPIPGNTRRPQPGQGQSPKPEQERPPQAEPQAQSQGTRPEKPKQKVPTLSQADLEARIQRGVQQREREGREKEEAAAVLKALEEGRVGRLERENSRGGRRMN